MNLRRFCGLCGGPIKQVAAGSRRRWHRAREMNGKGAEQRLDPSGGSAIATGGDGAGSHGSATPDPADCSRRQCSASGCGRQLRWTQRIDKLMRAAHESLPMASPLVQSAWTHMQLEPTHTLAAPVANLVATALPSADLPAGCGITGGGRYGRRRGKGGDHAVHELPHLLGGHRVRVLGQRREAELEVRRQLEANEGCGGSTGRGEGGTLSNGSGARGPRCSSAVRTHVLAHANHMAMQQPALQSAPGRLEPHEQLGGDVWWRRITAALGTCGWRRITLRQWVGVVLAANRGAGGRP